MPRIAVPTNVMTAPKRGFLARLLLGGPEKKYTCDIFDFCNNCYPPHYVELARMAGVSERLAAKSIYHAQFEGAFHESYQEDDYICCLCGKELTSIDN